MITLRKATFVSYDTNAVRRYEIDLRNRGWQVAPCISELDEAYYGISRIPSAEEAGLIVFRGLGLKPGSCRSSGGVFTSQNTNNWLYANLALIEQLCATKKDIFPRQAIFVAHPNAVNAEPVSCMRERLGLTCIAESPNEKEVSEFIEKYWADKFSQ